MHGADPGLNGKLELLNLAEAELRAPIWIDLEENSWFVNAGWSWYP